MGPIAGGTAGGGVGGGAGLDRVEGGAEVEPTLGLAGQGARVHCAGGQNER